MKSIKLHILVTQDIIKQLLHPDFWPGIKNDIAEYISKWMKCQQVKVEHQHPTSLLQPFPTPEQKWEVISMDFITGFPMTMRQHDSIMVVVDKLTKASHFIPVKSTYKADAIANIFMKEIFRLHGLPKEIIFDSDTNLFQIFGRVSLQIWVQS